VIWCHRRRRRNCRATGRRSLSNVETTLAKISLRFRNIFQDCSANFQNPHNFYGLAAFAVLIWMSPRLRTSISPRCRMYPELLNIRVRRHRLGGGNEASCPALIVGWGKRVIMSSPVTAASSLMCGKTARTPHHQYSSSVDLHVQQDARHLIVLIRNNGIIIYYDWLYELIIIIHIHKTLYHTDLHVRRSTVRCYS
jgi:hypothetical protein